MSKTETQTDGPDAADDVRTGGVRADRGGADDRELGAAGSQLSTAPEDRINVPVLGILGWTRWFWRQLTSMRVALILLFLLSLGSIPGSLIPQDNVDPIKVEEFRTRHETLAPLYDSLGLFHVYSSVWFSAIYILLFVSLIGCIVPRSWQFVGQLRGRPPAAPRRLTRLPAYTTWRTGAEPAQVLSAAHRMLGRRRFRVHTPGDAVAAEKGYLREAGNLVFHVALIVMLVAFASGQLWKAEGGKLIVDGDGFSNTLTQYDDFRSGDLFDSDALAPFGFSLHGFESSYERTGPEKGTAREFRAHVKYWEGADGTEHSDTIEVNEPLDVAGNKVYLLGNGYAPVVTVKDGQGDIAYQGPVPFLPQDKNLTSVGVVKVPDYRDKNGKKNQLGFQGRFTPTYALDAVRGPHSSFPALDYPVLSLNAFRGSLGIDSGLPQNVYQLDTRKMKQFKDENGDLFRKALRPGETMTLPDGAGSLTFDGVKTWASFQISYQPANGLALGGALAALAGLAASLFIQRRRVWVRAVRGDDGTTVVEMAGLGRSESAKLPEELADLAVALQPDAPPVAEEPSTDDPAAEQPSTDHPTAEQPSTDVPVAEQPGTEKPSTDDPAAEQPGTEEPDSEHPVNDLNEPPAAEHPANAAPVRDDRGSEAPATDNRAAGDSATPDDDHADPAEGEGARA
ncbi:cytochrome c biogenesis protein ResB [Streptomyces sp. NPDC051776]|uniref:cytochrome c biogenesis protein ResB n=1 Tax=Streptomyces sp. NPDC051776 TaxID=3155414 RepID=UPI003440A326